MATLREANIRHAEHYRSVLEVANTLLLKGGEDSTTGLQLFDNEWPNIQAAWAWAEAAIASDVGAAGFCPAINDAGSHLLDLRQHPLERVRWLKTAIEVTQNVATNRLLECLLLANLGSAHLRLGQPHQAIKILQESLRIARELKNSYAAGVAFGSLGNAYANLGDANNAIKYYLQDLQICRRAGDKSGEGEVLLNLGGMYSRAGDDQSAFDCFEQALVIARNMRNRRNEAGALGNLGVLYRRAGECEKAIANHKLALESYTSFLDLKG